MCCHGNMGSESDMGCSHLVWLLCRGPVLLPSFGQLQKCMFSSRAFSYHLQVIQINACFWLRYINNFCDICFSLWLARTYIVPSSLSLVPVAHDSCWSVRGGQGHEQSFSLGIRFCVSALLRISWRNQDTRMRKALFFWLFYQCCSGVCVFSSASVFVMLSHICYTIQLWLHGCPCWSC